MFAIHTGGVTSRNPFLAPDVQSRRGGPQKEPLSRDAIVETALQLLHRDGLDGMSLRKVAAALHTGAASLYAYVDNLQELQALVLDRAIGKTSFRVDAAKDWREGVHHLLASYLAVLTKSPGLAQLAFGTLATGPHALRFLDSMLGQFERGNVDKARAAWAVDMLMLYINATALEQSSRSHSPDPLGPMESALRLVTARDYPNIDAAREELMSGPGRIKWGIDVILNGLGATPVPSPPAQARPRKRRGN